MLQYSQEDIHFIIFILDDFVIPFIRSFPEHISSFGLECFSFKAS